MICPDIKLAKQQTNLVEIQFIILPKNKMQSYLYLKLRQVNQLIHTCKYGQLYMVNPRTPGAPGVRPKPPRWFRPNTNARGGGLISAPPPYDLENYAG